MMYMLEMVKKFRFSDALITDDGTSESEIRMRIGMAKNAFSRRKELLTRSMSKAFKKIVNSCMECS